MADYIKEHLGTTHDKFVDVWDCLEKTVKDVSHVYLYHAIPRYPPLLRNTYNKQKLQGIDTQFDVITPSIHYRYAVRISHSQLLILISFST